MRLSVVFKIHYMKKFNIIIITNKTLKKTFFFSVFIPGSQSSMIGKVLK